MVVVDASVWTSGLLESDSNHLASSRWITEWSGSGQAVLVPALFLVEVSGAVSRNTGQSVLGRRAVANILLDPTVTIFDIHRRLAQSAAPIAADLPLKGADAIYVALAEKLGVPLISWDKEHLNRARSIITVLAPTA